MPGPLTQVLLICLQSVNFSFLTWAKCTQVKCSDLKKIYFLYYFVIQKCSVTTFFNVVKYMKHKIYHF